MVFQEGNGNLTGYSYIIRCSLISSVQTPILAATFSIDYKIIIGYAVHIQIEVCTFCTRALKNGFAECVELKIKINQSDIGNRP